jgi:hypothetical protein
LNIVLAYLYKRRAHVKCKLFLQCLVVTYLVLSEKEVAKINNKGKLVEKLACMLDINFFRHKSKLGLYPFGLSHP